MRTFFHLVAATLALLLAITTLVHLRSQLHDKERLLERLAQGETLPLGGDLLADLRREPDADYAGLLAARALLAQALAPGERPDDLPLARELSAAALRRHPASWQASMILGAATYLHWSKEEDPRLFRQPRAWEAPLLHAAELAPGRPEPRRFLATAYLEVWPALSPAKRELTRRLLAEALTDPATFSRLIEPWLSVAESREEALALIPPTSFAWGYLEAQASRAGDWPEYLLARRNREDATKKEQRALLLDAETRLRGGDLRWGRSQLLRLIAVTRPSGGNAALLERALEQMPAGPGNAAAETALAAWLRWAMELCLLSRCPFSTSTLDRMAGLAGELPEHEVALAAALTDRLEEGERLERRAEDLWHPRWGPYFLAKARALLLRKNAAEAADALHQLPRTWADQALSWQVRWEVARAAGDGEAETRAQNRLHALTKDRWQAGEWSWEAPRDRLTGLAGRPGHEISLGFPEVPQRGGVVEIRLDGSPIGVVAVKPGEPVALAVALEPGLHLWEVETLTGGRLAPSELRLLDLP